MTTVDEEALHRALDEVPRGQTDPTTRRILADLYEDQGKDLEAKFHRLMADKGWHPSNRISKDGSSDGWYWFTTGGNYDPDEHACIGNLYHTIRNIAFPNDNTSTNKPHPSRQQAEHYLMLALIETKQL